MVMSANWGATPMQTFVSLLTFSAFFAISTAFFPVASEYVLKLTIMMGGLSFMGLLSVEFGFLKVLLIDFEKVIG